jgi:uroporphyrin-3 C-methyltransferase
MSETTTDNAATDATPPATEPSPPAAPPPRPRGGWLGIVLILVVAAGAGGGGYYLDRLQRERFQAVDAEVAALKQQLTETDSRYRADEGKTAALSDKIDSGLQKLQDSQKAISQSLAQIAERQPKSYDQWRLREAQYLLGIASERLQLERDVGTAISAVEAADARLGESRDPSFIPIREQVIADLNSLRAVKPVDISGLSLYLADLIDRVDTLPLRNNDYEIKNKAKNQRPQINNWRDLVHSLWHDLVQLVQVKDMSVPDDVVFDPGKRYLLQFNLRLELAAARLQAMRFDTDNFRASLKHVEMVLKRYYDTNDQQVGNVIETLDKMQQLDLAPPLPNLDKSLQMVRDRLAGIGSEKATP